MKIGRRFKTVNIILFIIIVITFICVLVFRSSASLQDRLFELMESFFHRSLDRAEWQERFSGSWIYFPMAAEIKLLGLMWVGYMLAILLKTDKWTVSENSKINAFFSSNKMTVFNVIVVVFLFSIAFYLTPSMMPDGSGTPPSFIWIICGLLFFAGMIFLFRKAIGFLKIKSDSKHQASVNKRILVLFFIAVMMVDICWFIVYYPGVAMTDTRVVALQGLTISSQHPWLYCLMVDMLIRIMKAAGPGYEGAFVFMSLLQILLSSLVFTHCIYVLMREKVNNYIAYVVGLIYALCPIFCLYTIYLVKDILYSLVVIEWVIFLYDYWRSNGNTLSGKNGYLRVILLCIGTLFRNNGLYMMMFVIVGMFLLDIYNYKKVLVISFVMVCTVALSSTVEAAGGITHNFRETVGIPLQQISAVVASDGDITDEQLAFINRILPVDEIKEYYDPSCVDSIKFREDFDWEFLNAHKSEFIMTWAQIFRNNIGIYMEAYGKGTYGFWAVNRGNIERPDSLNYGFDQAFTDENNIQVKGILPEGIQSRLEGIMYPLTDITFGEGQLFWIICLLMVVFVFANGNRAFMVASPVIGGYLTLFIASPSSYCWRYAYYIALAIPLMTGLLFADNKKEP